MIMAASSGQRLILLFFIPFIVAGIFLIVTTIKTFKQAFKKNNKEPNPKPQNNTEIEDQFFVKLCSNCGGDLRKIDKFCPHCGKEIK